MKYFPAYLNLKNRNILVVGTGHEVESKVLQLLQTGALLKLISDERPSYIYRLEDYNNFTFEQRRFNVSDLDNVWLVISTLGKNNRKINEYIFNTAAGRNILCNVVDVPELCSFIFPAMITHGDINIAISTSGASPALAQNIKAKISDLIGPEYGLLAEILGRSRKEILERLPHKKERSNLFHYIVNSGAIELLKQCRYSDAEMLISKIIKDELRQSIQTNSI